MLKLEDVKMGDKLVCAMRKSSYFTVGESYEVYSKSSDEDGLAIRDDDDDLYYVDSDDLKEYHFILEGSYEHGRLLEYLDLQVGEYITPSSNYNGLKVGKEYKIGGRRDGTRSVHLELDEDRLLLPFLPYMSHFDPSNLDEPNHLTPQDYMSLVDAAIDTKDEEWFKEIVLKAEGHVNII